MTKDKYFHHKLNIYLTYGCILLVTFAIFTYKAIADGSITSVTTPLIIISIFFVVFSLCEVVLYFCQAWISLTDINQGPVENFYSTISRNFNIVLTMAIVICILLFLGLLIIVRWPFNYIWELGPSICIPSIIFAFLLLRIITSFVKWETRLSTLHTLKGLDYGTGLAYSYYYGYLRMILPSTGTASKSLLEKIENFEDNHNVTFPVHKLFILIPSSSYIPPDLKEASYQWMESVHELEEEKRNRAGNIGRTYHNNAYKIYPGGRNSGISPKYVVVEGATPLLTFYEVQKHTHPESKIYKEYKNEIVMNFYEKLQEILQSELDTKDLCELIYYDDYDSNGVKTNVAKIILERLDNITVDRNKESVN